MSETNFEHWCILELFGHQKIAGYVTEMQIAGQGFIQVNVPENQKVPQFTKLYGPTAIYAITPVTEEVARAVAASPLQAPVTEYELPQLQSGGKKVNHMTVSDDFSFEEKIMEMQDDI